MDYNKPQRVRILETSYNPETDLALWLLELSNGDRYPFQFPRTRTEEAIQVNLKGPPTPSLLVEFNEKMVGKTINMVVKEMEQE